MKLGSVCGTMLNTEIGNMQTRPLITCHHRHCLPSCRCGTQEGALHCVSAQVALVSGKQGRVRESAGEAITGRSAILGLPNLDRIEANGFALVGIPLALNHILDELSAL